VLIARVLTRSRLALSSLQASLPRRIRTTVFERKYG
jgi:hypothetical protein